MSIGIDQIQSNENPVLLLSRLLIEMNLNPNGGQKTTTSRLVSTLPLFPLVWERRPHALFPSPMGLTRSVSLRLPSMVSFVSDELTKAIVFPETVASLRERWLKRSDCKLRSSEDIRWRVVEFQRQNCDNLNRDEAPEINHSMAKPVGR